MNQSIWSRLFGSVTVWFNIVVFSIAVLTLPEFKQVLPASLIPYDLLGAAIGNTILRIFFTAQPIAPVSISFKKLDFSPAKASVPPTQADV